ncbi:unnamed protein product, partial [Ceratitis capitata]
LTMPPLKLSSMPLPLLVNLHARPFAQRLGTERLLGTELLSLQMATCHSLQSCFAAGVACYLLVARSIA